MTHTFDQRAASRPTRPGRSTALLLTALVLAACAHSQPTRFYALHARPPSTSPTSVVAPPIRVLAVRPPAMLDRLEVVRDGPAGIAVDDLERWVAPLGDLARAALSQDLQDRLPGVEVFSAHATAAQHTRDIVVEIRSLRQRGEGFELDATFEISGPPARGPDRQEARLFAPFSGVDAKAQAEALSLLLADLADLIVARLKRPDGGS